MSEITTPSAPTSPVLPIEKTEEVLPETIGIWNLATKNGEPCYVRSTDRTQTLHHWAVTPNIYPKSDKYRIAYLGESVARGYLYDPNFTPADVLAQLVNHSEKLDVEVLDLARTNCDLVELDELSEKCMYLNPDALVIFAGNNWIMTIRESIQSEDYEEIISLQKTAGIDVVKDWFDKRAYVLVKNYFEHLYELRKDSDIPIILMIPEFNLLGWTSSEREQIAAHQSEEEMTNFQALKLECDLAYSSNDWNKVETHAEKLVNMDPSSPVGYEYLAKCAMAREDFDEARKQFNNALDTAVYYRVVSKPRCFSFIREHMLALAPKYNIEVVDLPEVFSNHLDGRLPGGDMFLDYCHLTYEGIQVAMAATAEKLLQTTNHAVDNSKSNGFEKTLTPNDDVIAYANFTAAVHNAHFGQPYERLLELCQDALESSDEVKKVMINYADFASRDLPNYLCKSYSNIVDNDLLQQYEGGMGLLGKKGSKIIDIALVDAIADALYAKGCDLYSTIHDLRQQEHGVADKNVNLLKSFYSSDSYYSFNGNKSPFYSARGNSSSFFVFAEEGKTMYVDMSYRTPNVKSVKGNVKIRCNGHVVGCFEPATVWENVKVQVSNEWIKSGMNILSIDWPYAESSETIAKFIDRAHYETEWYDSNFPVSGQLHALNATQLMPRK